MTLPNCGACNFYQPGRKLCFRHAPSPTDAPMRRAFWPTTEEWKKCGEGSTEKHPIPCVDCEYWWQPGGNPLSGPQTSTYKPEGFWGRNSTKDDRLAQEAEWWKHSGFCTRYAASPGDGENRPMHHRATHAVLDCCGDGKKPSDDDACDGSL